MTYTTFILLGAIAGVLFFTAFKLTIAIYTNFRMGLRLRNAFLERLKLLRLNKVLSQYDIDTRVYLHTQPLNEIEQQIRQCESCPATYECDKALKNQHISAAELAFRPKINALKEYCADVEATVPAVS